MQLRPPPYPGPFSSADAQTTVGAMGSGVVGGLVNSVARFIHLVSCQTMRNAPVVKYLRNAAAAMKLLKPVLDGVIDSHVGFSAELASSFEELDALVNEAREIAEKHTHRISKICNVLQCEPIVIKVQNSSMEICRILSKSLQPFPPTSLSACVQHCMQELECTDQGNTSELIEISLRDQRDYGISSPEHIIKIAESLGFASNEELLMERIALEKEKTRIELVRSQGDSGLIDQAIELVKAIGPCLEKQRQCEVKDRLPIPPYFRCPLSSELMLDPVILASGQTFERCSIRKWLDSGLRICPSTRQILAHTNLVPNYTVKVLITNWCEENGVTFGHSVDPGTALSPSSCHLPSGGPGAGRNFLGPIHTGPGLRPSELGDGPERQRAEVSTQESEEEGKEGEEEEESSFKSCYRILSDEAFTCDPFLGRHPSGHSRSESVSSAISTLEMMSRSDDKTVVLPAAQSPSPNHSSFSPWSQGGSNYGYDGRTPSSTPGSRSDDPADYSLVERLVDDLKSGDEQVRAAAALELRLLAKHSSENRILIARCGAIPALVSLLDSEATQTQENAVTALLNLSINNRNKVAVAEAGAVEPLIHVLKCGSMVARENAAATLSSLAVLEEYKIRIGRTAAVKALVDLLGSGNLRGKKDAATALFSLSIIHENKARIVQAGAVRHLVQLMDPDGGMVDKAVALVANLSTISEGCLAIAQVGGIPLLVEVVEAGSEKGKENAASALLQLCMNNHKFCSLVLQEGAVPPLIALSHSGTPRAKEKAQQILSQFRCQREGNFGRRP